MMAETLCSTPDGVNGMRTVKLAYKNPRVLCAQRLTASTECELTLNPTTSGTSVRAQRLTASTECELLARLWYRFVLSVLNA